MRISVVQPSELGPGEVGAWHAMQDQGEEFRNPFLSPEFAIAAGQVVPDARVAVVEEAGSRPGSSRSSSGGSAARDRSVPG